MLLYSLTISNENWERCISPMLPFDVIWSYKCSISLFSSRCKWGGWGCPHGILITRYTPVPRPSPTKNNQKVLGIPPPLNFLKRLLTTINDLWITLIDYSPTCRLVSRWGLHELVWVSPRRTRAGLLQRTHAIIDLM